MNRIALLLLVFVSGIAGAAEQMVVVPVEATCQEHITSEPRLSLEDWPKRMRDREVSAYVVVSYRLDGSGKATDAVVTDSQPAGVFDKTTLSALNRTKFAPGAEAQACVYVRTYGSVIRGAR